MARTNEYVCPICNQGTITIQEERVGAPGFRETDYDIVNMTCKCITVYNDLIILSIKNYTDKEIEKGKACEDCGDLEANIIYPTKPWTGEAKDICISCFKKKVQI